MNKLQTLTGLALAISLAGCGLLKKKTPEPAPSVTVAAVSAAPPPVAVPTPAPTPEPAPVAAVEPPLDEAAIPAPQDFEDEAFDKVTKANFKTELTRLTKEIATK